MYHPLLHYTVSVPINVKVIIYTARPNLGLLGLIHTYALCVTTMQTTCIPEYLELLFISFIRLLKSLQHYFFILPKCTNNIHSNAPALHTLPCGMLHPKTHCVKILKGCYVCDH